MNSLSVAPALSLVDHGLVDDVRDLAASDDVLRSLRHSAQLADEVRCRPRSLALVDDLDALVATGPFAGMIAVELLAAIDHPAAGESLAGLLAAEHPLLARHAAWRLGGRQPTPAAVPGLLDLLAIGGIATMHAHRTLRRWATAAPAIVEMTMARLAATADERQRARIVDLLGTMDPHRTTDLLVALVADPDELRSARIAAIGALSDRLGAGEVALRRLATGMDEVGTHAALAVAVRARAGTPRAGVDRAGSGLRVAQLTMAAGLDGELSLGGRGDTGGVASLLVSLGDALARRPEIDRVLTIGRGTVSDALAGSSLRPDSRLVFTAIAIGDEGRPALTADDLWEHLPTIERGIRSAIAVSGGIDVLHLRMADAGTLAGAHTAAALGIETCFSLAPDPHNVLAALQSRGEAGHDAVVRLATESHIWFRARLVERLAHDADQIALFPRGQRFELCAELGRPDRLDQRRLVVAEGIDIGLIRRAEAGDEELLSEHAPAGGILAAVAAAIPDDRRDLPLLVSVGRLHPVKGMDRIVAAWAADPRLHARCNLVIVGGALDEPSSIERTVLAAIERLVPVGDARRRGLQLLGGRPRADVARLLVSAARGRPTCWPAGGVYVDGAWKEEFGLAVIEALAAGLVVVAPSTGGPPTYVDDGDIGVLVDPDADLGAAIRRAFGLVGRPGRAGRARRLIEQRYSVDTMAERLTELYRTPAVQR